MDCVPLSQHRRRQEAAREEQDGSKSGKCNPATALPVWAQRAGSAARLQSRRAASLPAHCEDSVRSLQKDH